MCRVAWGVIGFGDWILETDRGRPLGISTDKLKLSRRDSRLDLDEEECLSLDDDEEWCFEEEECLSLDEDECFEDEDDLCDEDL